MDLTRMIQQAHVEVTYSGHQRVPTEDIRKACEQALQNATWRQVSLCVSKALWDRLQNDLAGDRAQGLEKGADHVGEFWLWSFADVIEDAVADWLGGTRMVRSRADLYEAVKIKVSLDAVAGLED